MAPRLGFRPTDRGPRNLYLYYLNLFCKNFSTRTNGATWHACKLPCAVLPPLPEVPESGRGKGRAPVQEAQKTSGQLGLNFWCQVARL